MTKVAGLLLAAGMSSRMGQPKQTLPVGEGILLDIVLGQALESDLNPVTLVLGHQARDIKKALKIDPRHPKLRIVENSHYQEGISTSIIAGLSEVQEARDHVMILLADMPRINKPLINHFITQYLASGCSLGAMRVQGKRSHPVIFSRRFYPDLHGLKGDQGGRELFLEHPEEICLVEPETPYEDRDIDTYQDYLDFQKTLQE